MPLNPRPWHGIATECVCLETSSDGPRPLPLDRCPA